MNKKQEAVFKENLEILLNNIEEVYKLAALTDKFCEQNKDSDDLYEISCIIKIIKDKIDKFSRNLHYIIHMNDEPFSYEGLGDRIKSLIKNK